MFERQLQENREREKRMLEFREREAERERQHDYETTHLFSLFSDANARIPAPSNLILVELSSALNTKQAAGPFLPPSQQLFSTAWMFQVQSSLRSIESLYAQDRY